MLGRAPTISVLQTEGKQPLQYIWGIQAVWKGIPGRGLSIPFNICYCPNTMVGEFSFLWVVWGLRYTSGMGIYLGDVVGVAAPSKKNGVRKWTKYHHFKALLSVGDNTFSFELFSTLIYVQFCIRTHTHICLDSSLTACFKMTVFSRKFGLNFN